MYMHNHTHIIGACVTRKCNAIHYNSQCKSKQLIHINLNQNLAAGNNCLKHLDSTVDKSLQLIIS